MIFDKDKMDEVLNEFLDSIFEEYDIPGVSIGLSIGDSYEFRGAAGYRDFSTRFDPKPSSLDKDDIFHCASVSKLMTTSAIMKILESTDADFNLDSYMTDILPGYSLEDKRYGDVKLWNMLTHTAGIGDCDDYEWYAPDMDIDAIYNYICRNDVAGQSMLWKPQNRPMADENRFRYSNNAFEILGYLASEKSPVLSGCKRSYEELIKYCIFQPLDMNSSSMRTYDRPDWGTDVMAKPHAKNENNDIELLDVYPYNPAHAPSSTLTTNTADLLKWGRAHLGNSRFFKDETYDKMWTGYAIVPNNGEHMGLGWFMRKQEVCGTSYTLYGHEGTDDGFRASFWICPKLDMVLVVLSNLSGSPVKRINKKLFSTVLSAFK